MPSETNRETSMNEKTIGYVFALAFMLCVGGLLGMGASSIFYYALEAMGLDLQGLWLEFWRSVVVCGAYIVLSLAIIKSFKKGA